MEIREVQETWWHRLIAVVLGWFWLLSSLAAAYFAWAVSEKTVYSYSWRLPYIATDHETSCEPSIYYAINQANFFCGEFTDAGSAVDDMVSVGYITKSEQIPTPRTPISDARVLEAVSKQHPIKSSWEQRISWPEMRKNGGYALLFSIVLWLLIAFLQKIIFYIAYGARHRIIR